MLFPVLGNEAQQNTGALIWEEAVAALRIPLGTFRIQHPCFHGRPTVSLCLGVRRPGNLILKALQVILTFA